MPQPIPTPYSVKISAHRAFGDGFRPSVTEDHARVSEFPFEPLAKRNILPEIDGRRHNGNAILRIHHSRITFVPVAEALSRVVPDSNRRMILSIRHGHVR
jgi:hypothetical protein